MLTQLKKETNVFFLCVVCDILIRLGGVWRYSRTVTIVIRRVFFLMENGKERLTRRLMCAPRLFCSVCIRQRT